MDINIKDIELWSDIDGLSFTDAEVKSHMTNYISKGGKAYVGSDSQLFPDICNFVTVIALHDVDQNVARYYFKRFRVSSHDFTNLSSKILKEVELAVQTAQFVLELCPDAEIELHIDIGTTPRNKTRKFFKMINGWVTNIGFDLKVKPHSWASSLADGHTKGRRPGKTNNANNTQSSIK
tara:strand:- start:2574 stop:3110 length:537 start_codon:yes stop_codon:yes gene_type:complete